MKIGFVAEIHGNAQFDVSPTTKDNASLLVLRFTPAVSIPGKEFRKLTVELTFEPQQRGDDPPEIRSYEPDFSGFFSEDVINIKKTRALQASVAGQTPAGVSPQLSGTSTTEESYSIVSRLLLSTKIQNAPGRSYPNHVSWDVKAKNDRDGIGDWFQVALLLERSPGSQFKMRVEAHASIGLMARVRGLNDPTDSEDMEKGEVSTIGPLGPAPPDLKAQKIPDGIKVEDLSAAATEERLWPFFKFHTAQQLEATVLHKKTSTCQLHPVTRGGR